MRRGSPRGFSLSEIVVVVVVIGIAGSLATIAFSGQVQEAKARSEATALVLRLQTEHRATRERLQPLKITAEAGRVVFQPSRGGGCVTPDGAPRVADFERAALFISSGALCLTSHGEVDGSVPALAVHAALGDAGHLVQPVRLDRTGFHGEASEAVSDAELEAMLEKLRAANVTGGAPQMLPQGGG